MALDLLQLGQYMGRLEARIEAIENFVYSGASTSAPAEREPAEESADFNIPGLGSMKALFEGQMAQHGGAEGLVAKAFAAATAPPPAPAPAAAAAPTPPAQPAPTT